MNIFGQGVDDFLILFELEFLFDEVGFFNEVVDFGLEFFGDFVLVAHSVEVLEFFLFFFILGLDFTDDRPDATDVIGQSDATDSFNKNESRGFNEVRSANISKSDSQHDVSSPVISPDVFCCPVLILDVDFMIPVHSVSA